MNKKFTTLLFSLIASISLMASGAPVLHLKFSNNIADSSANQFGTTQLGNISYVDGRKSDANSSINCTAGGVKLNDNTGSYKVTFPFTFAAWIQVKNFNVVNPIFTSEDDQSVYSGIWIQVLQDGTVAANVGNGGTPNSTGRKSAVTNSPVITATNTWYQVVVIANSISDFAIYVNGSLAPSTLSGSASSLVYVNGSNNNGKIGSYNKGSVNNYYFDGIIDELALYGYAASGQFLTDILTEGAINYTGVKSTENIALNLYPNPASENALLEIPAEFSASSTTISIYNALGVLVKQETVNAAGVHQISVEDLAKGAYFIQVSNNTLTAKQTLIVH